MCSTKGTILYFAILILGALFAISAGLSLIVFGQMKIQREIGHSVIALHAADTGVERALYAIYKGGALQNPASCFSENLGPDLSYNVCIYQASTGKCRPQTQVYCIISRGTFKQTTRAIDASF
jgi:hypothetical protein